MGKADEVSGRSVFDAEFLFLQLLDPTTAPAPQSHRIADYLCGSLESKLPLEEGLGLTIVLEDTAVSIAIEVEAVVPQERLPGVTGFIASDTKIDRRFGKGGIEVVGTDQKADRGDADTNRDQPHILVLKALFHAFRVSRLGCTAAIPAGREAARSQRGTIT